MKADEDNIILQKSYAFSLRIIEVYKYLSFEKKLYSIADQLLRCGTSIGANMQEAVGGQSKKDFITKVQIAFKEARESRYWISSLKDSSLLQSPLSESLLKDIDEIIRIFDFNTKYCKTKLIKLIVFLLFIINS